jgi:hypothetical protein
MRELTEIVLLDFLFGQQDRIGNIDYQWHWVFLHEGQVKTQKEKREEYEKIPRREMTAIEPPTEIAAFQPVLVQKSSIGDNDAALRVQYTNFAKRSKMLERVRHFHAEAYRQLLLLNADLQAKGPAFSHLLGTLNLTEAEAAAIAKNSAEAVRILGEGCRAGKLRFDLELTGIVSGTPQEQSVDCDRP